MSSSTDPFTLPGVVTVTCRRSELVDAAGALGAGPLGSTVQFPDRAGSLALASVGDLRVVDLWANSAGLVTQGARLDGGPAVATYWPRLVAPAAIARLLALEPEQVRGELPQGPPDPFILDSPKALLQEVADGHYGQGATGVALAWEEGEVPVNVARLHLPGLGSWWGRWNGPGDVTVLQGEFETMVACFLDFLAPAAS